MEPAAGKILALVGAAVILIASAALIWRWIPHVAEQPSIVVLPFDDLSPGHDSEYFADGLTDEIIGKLSQVRALKVISRTTATALKGTRKPLRAIAEEVRVRYVLEGSVAKAGDSLRINTKLIDATSDTPLWADQRSGTLDDVFEMQEKVSRAIVDGLKLKLNPMEERKIARRAITNTQAFDCYLHARVAMRRLDLEGTNEAILRLQNCLNLTGENALLDAALGYAHYQSGNIGVQQEEAFTKAEAYAQRALRLDQETALAHIVLGLVAVTPRGDPQQAVRHLKQALLIEPNNLDALWWLISSYAVTGKVASALPLADRLTEIDPLAPESLAGRGATYWLDGHFDLSVDAYRRLLALTDKNIDRFQLSYVLACRKRFEEARALLEPIGSADDIIVQLSRFLKLALNGEKKKVPELLKSEVFVTIRRDCLYSTWVAEFYALLDEKEQALDWLENAVKRGFINYPYLNEYSPFFAKLRSDPRFEKLMVRVKGEWERFEP